MRFLDIRKRHIEEFMMRITEGILERSRLVRTWWASALKTRVDSSMTDRNDKDRGQLLSVLQSQAKVCGVDSKSSVLVIGASKDDLDLLMHAGFSDITLSNVSDLQIDDSVPRLKLNAQSIDLPDEAYDLVFAHAVLHHCRSPHLALCEMLRVSRRYVLFLEPHDSWFMRLLIKTRFSFPYEIPAVVDNGFICGGVDDSQIPNFIYRWNENEVFKAVSSYMPERRFLCHVLPYWDFYVNEKDLDLRKQTRIGAITSIIGTRNLVRLLRCTQSFLNLLPPLRSQGNKVLVAIVKEKQLWPWLRAESREVVFNREFANTN
jgi:SAM-dependent methyltransferase